MKVFLRMIAILLAFLLGGVGCLAESGNEEAEYFGAFGETPEELILSSMEIFSWFTIWPLDVDPELISSDGKAWRVADETLCRYDTMLKLLQRTFSEDIIAELMAYETYTVIDGVLYGTAGGRPIDPNISWVEYVESGADDEKVVYTVTVHYYGEGENGIEPDVLEFVRERIGDEWLFTIFPFFW